MIEEQFKNIILEYEAEPGFIGFDDLRHLAQNIATRTGAEFEHAYYFVLGWFSVQPDNITNAARALGSMTSPKKAASSAANGRKGGRRSYVNVDERYGGQERATISQYRKLNPEAEFTQDARGIYEINPGGREVFVAKRKTT